MRQFRTLLILGVILVTLLLLIDIINAGKKEGKKNGSDTKKDNGIENLRNVKNGKLKISENGNSEKSKKLREETSSSSNKKNEENTIEKSTIIKKKGKKHEKKEGKITKDKNPKITKTYQKVKKYKIVEDVPAKKYVSNKKTQKKNTPQYTYKEEAVDSVYSSLKKVPQNKKHPRQENSIDYLRNGELNKVTEEEQIFVEEGSSGDKRKKYKLVEVALEDDEETQEVNETIVDSYEDEENVGEIQRTESEEFIEKFKTTQTLKLPKKRMNPSYEPNTYKSVNDIEEELIEGDNSYDCKDENSEPIENDNMHLDENKYSSKYVDTHNPDTLQRCKPLPEDPDREGPKKLTLYVIEEEINGQIKKRVVSEEDGVTMCEVAELLEQHYYGSP